MGKNTKKFSECILNFKQDEGDAKLWIHFQFITPLETISVSSGIQSKVFRD